MSEDGRRRLRKRADCDEEKTEKVESRGCAGAGVMKYANGSVYKGEWKDEKKHGRGIRGGRGRRDNVSGNGAEIGVKRA